MILSLPVIAAVSVVFVSSASVLLYKLCRRLGLFVKVDENCPHHGGELVAEVLKAHNVSFLFTLCGGHISPILVASEKVGIRVIDVRHEASAVFAADAVSRLSGTVGVAAVTAGPGITNTVTAIKNAQMAESPVVLLAGAAAGLLRGRGSLQDIDQLTLFRSLCKFTARVTRVCDIVPLLCRAFHEAASDTPGPVMVEFPIDTLYPYNLVKQHMKMNPNPKGIRQRMINWYLRCYLFRLFADAFPNYQLRTPTEVTGVTTDRLISNIPVCKPRIPLPRNSQIEQLAKLLADAQRPIIVVGSQATLPPVDVQTTADNLKLIGIPMYLSGMARGLLGRSHPLGFRHARRAALKEADVVLLAGAVCDFRLDYGRVFGRRSRVVIINRNNEQLYKNADIFWRPHIAICADVGSTLQLLADIMSSRFPTHDACRVPQSWMQTLQERELKRDDEIRRCTLVQPGQHNNPLSVLLELEELGLTDDSIIVADGGDFVGSAAYILKPRGPLGWLDPGPFGTLGVGGGFALGAKLCRPKSTVWVIYGDGSAGFSIAEWDSLARHSAPAIGVIGNDAAWSQIARDQVVFFGSDVACGLRFTPYELIGAAYTGQSEEIRSGDGSHSTRGAFLLGKSNFKEFPAILTQAIKLSQEGQPVVINCLIGSSGFRDGSISV